MAKLNAIVCCTQAVFTDPYWHLIGVLEQIWVRSNETARFDVFIKLGDVLSTFDSDITIVVRSFDDGPGEVIANRTQKTRGGGDGVALAKFSLEVEFEKEGTFNVEAYLNGALLDEQKLKVLIID
ncbi:MAG: hypothetical protein IT462_04095 [Planctomycetes bacterium]|nr:hypothetical protein [Planctomycetota bacterium]